MREFLCLQVSLLLSFSLYSFATRMFHWQLSVCTRLSINIYFLLVLLWSNFIYLFVFFFLPIKKSLSNFYFYTVKDKTLQPVKQSRSKFITKTEKQNFRSYYFYFILLKLLPLRSSVFIIHVNMN